LTRRFVPDASKKFFDTTAYEGAEHKLPLYTFALDSQTETPVDSAEFDMEPQLTPRQQVVLAALAAHSGAEFAPVQVQKLFFLMDENIAGALGGKQFAFEPYDFGPFDKTVYQELDALARVGLVRIEAYGPSKGQRRYALTPAGQEMGTAALQKFGDEVRKYISDTSSWIRGLSFAQLVGSIYKAYPRMREKSVFQD
jgi:hypothetical protein